MDAKDAVKAFEEGADLFGAFYLPLEGSKLAPKGNWSGVITTILYPEKHKTLEVLEVALLCEKYDKGKMGQFLAEAGRNQEIEIEQDPDDSSLYFSDDSERKLLIALGDRVIAISVDISE